MNCYINNCTLECLYKYKNKTNNIDFSCKKHKDNRFCTLDINLDFLGQKCKCIVLNEKMYNIYIGRNAENNHELIKLSHPKDIWFHLHNSASSHIILNCKDDNVNMTEANICEIAATFFLKKNVIESDVIFTNIENVTLLETPGSVATKDVQLIKYQYIKPFVI